jgi:hypothetical protein
MRELTTDLNDTPKWFVKKQKNKKKTKKQKKQKKQKKTKKTKKQKKQKKTKKTKKLFFCIRTIVIELILKRLLY